MASTGDIAVITIDELKNVLQSLKQQRETISNTYNGMITSILDSSSSCLSIAGLNYSKISESYRKIFTDIDNNFANLIDLLENDVIRNYMELSLAIREMFNVEFASKMSTLLGL